MRTPEGVVKQEIRTYLKSVGAYFFLPVQVGMGARTLDILACINGRFVGIEVKRPGKQATALQARTIKEISDAKGLAFTADNVERVKKFVEDFCFDKYRPPRLDP